MASTAQALLEALFLPLTNEERIELRVRLPNGRVFSRWAPLPAGLLTLARRLPGKADVWFGVAPRMGTSRDAAHVTRLGALWSDVDAKCFADGMAGAKAAVRQLTVPPSALVDSGHGLHAYWLLASPACVTGDGSTARNILRGLQHHLGRNAVRPLDAVHDFARVLRLPDTWNAKQPPPIPVRVLELDQSRRYHLDDFLDAGIHATDPVWSAPANGRAQGCVTPPHEARSGELPAWVLDALHHPERHLRASRSELDFAVLCWLVPVFGVTQAEALWLTSTLGDRDKVQQRPDYRARTLRTVLDRVGTTTLTQQSAGGSL